MLFFFPRGVLDEILNLIESVSGGFPSCLCTTLCLAVIVCFTSIINVFYLFVGYRDLKSQNKMDFRETFRTVCLLLDNTDAS